MNRDFKGVWIPRNIWEDKTLTWGEKLLFLEIDSLSKNGECFASNEHFSEFLDVGTRQIQNYLASLQSKGFIKIQLFYKGNTKIVTKRIISVLHKFTDEQNFAHTDEETFAHMDEQSFTRTGEEKFVDSNTISFNNTKSNTNNIKKINKKGQKNSNSAELESEFELLWQKYPRKIGRAKAFQSYIKARNTKKYTFETIEIGLNQYIEYIENQGTDEQYIAHFTTWLNQERFNDDYICTATQKKPKNVFEFIRNEYGGEDFDRTRNRKIIDHDTGELFESQF
jgi:adenylate kinase family enzyme